MIMNRDFIGNGHIKQSSSHGGCVPAQHRHNCCVPTSINAPQRRQHVLNCTFCLDRNPSDNIGHTHCVRDKNGVPWCTFLPLNICTVCFHKGHTASYCIHREEIIRKDMELTRMEKEKEEKKDDDVFLGNYYNAQLEVEVFRLRRMLALQILNGEMHGKCKYCTSLPYYSHSDLFMNNHGTKECPRIALFKCNYCGQRGHNEYHCKQKWEDTAPFVFGVPAHKRPKRWQNITIDLGITHFTTPTFELYKPSELDQTEKQKKILALRKHRRESSQDSKIGDRSIHNRRKTFVPTEEFFIDWSEFDDDQSVPKMIEIDDDQQVVPKTVIECDKSNDIASIMAGMSM